MGNQLMCLPGKEKGDSDRSPSPRSISRAKWGKGRSSRKDKMEEELLQQQALAMLLFQQKHGHMMPPGAMQFERSSSQRNPPPGPKQGLPRSASARPSSTADRILQAQELANQI